MKRIREIIYEEWNELHSGMLVILTIGLFLMAILRVWSIFSPFYLISFLFRIFLWATLWSGLALVIILLVPIINEAVLHWLQK